jgi:predicted nucleotidyltransferase
MDDMTDRAAEVGNRKAPTLAFLRANRDEILRIAESRGVSNIRVFGSVARGDATPDSDIDLLVDFKVRESGLDLIGFALDLEQLLGFRVEVGTSVHEVIRHRVNAQAVTL